MVETDCGPGLLCSGDPTFMSDVCRPACDPLDPTACGSFDCLSWSPSFFSETYDLCELPIEYLCDDDIDNDFDGAVDCDDDDCSEVFECLYPTEDTAALCSDGIDNNEDGLTDCDDASCIDAGFCG